jgi:5-methylthioadenosine/S-adenosylhomocysteine deaminase
MALTVIKGGTIITMGPSRRIIDNGAVVVKDDMVLDVGTLKEIKQKYSAEREIDASGKIVMPGLFDAHAHAGHSLLKSLGMHNEKWYKACEVIYSQASTPEFWEADALLASLERLKFGTTCGVTFMGGGDSVMRLDDPVYASKHVEAVEKVGIRTFLAVGPRRPPYPRKYSRWSGGSRRDYMVSFEDMLENSGKIIREFHGANDGKIHIATMFPVPHPERKPIMGAELSDLKKQSKASYELAKDNNLLFTMDGHDRGTIKFCHEELGLTGENSLFSHSTDLMPEEIEICAKTHTSIAHNPSAVASILGRCPVPELIDAGVFVALGSDAAAPDRSFDMFRHMFQAMRYHRRYYRDSRVLPPGKVLEMTTIDAANALGVGDSLGSIEKGKKADLIIIDADKPHLHPFNMPVDRVTYFANGNDVDTVMVNGEILMQGRQVLNIDAEKIFSMANDEISKAVERSGIKDLYDLTDNYWGKSRY